jgi:hypothetical protein
MLQLSVGLTCYARNIGALGGDWCLGRQTWAHVLLAEVHNKVNYMIPSFFLMQGQCLLDSGIVHDVLWDLEPVHWSIVWHLPFFHILHAPYFVHFTCWSTQMLNNETRYT